MASWVDETHALSVLVHAIEDQYHLNPDTAWPAASNMIVARRLDQLNGLVEQIEVRLGELVDELSRTRLSR